MMDEYTAAILGAISPQVSGPMSRIPAGYLTEKYAEAPSLNQTTQMLGTQITTTQATTVAAQPSYNAKLEMFNSDRTPRSVESISVHKPKNTTASGAKIDSRLDQEARGFWDWSTNEIASYTKGVSDLMGATASFYNGYIAQSSYQMQAASKEFEARQNERAAEMMLKNIRDINRQAQQDANVYRMQRVKTRSAQRAAMASSGFAVGKGDYAATLKTTDAYTNYNISMLNLKADLQNAEIVRKAGYTEAQAIVNRADAKILRKQGEIAKTQGIVNAMGQLMSAASNFAMGYTEYQSNKTGWGYKDGKEGYFNRGKFTEGKAPDGVLA